MTLIKSATTSFHSPSRDSLLHRLENASRFSAANLALAVQTIPGIVTPTRRPQESRLILVTERQRLYMFVKMFMKYLEKSNCPFLKMQVKRVITATVEGNRNNDTECTPLVDALEKRLAMSVGPRHWEQATSLFETLCARHQVRLMCDEPMAI